MTNINRKTRGRHEDESTQQYDMDGFEYLSLIAAPDPNDDLSDDELAAYCQDPRHSPELIRHLIEFVKKM